MVLTEVCGAFKSPEEASGAEKAGGVEGAMLPGSLAALLSTLSGIKLLPHCPWSRETRTHLREQSQKKLEIHTRTTQFFLPDFWL